MRRRRLGSGNREVLTKVGLPRRGAPRGWEEREIEGSSGAGAGEGVRGVTSRAGFPTGRATTRRPLAPLRERPEGSFAVGQ